MAEPTWIRLEAILAIHRRQIIEHGGGAGLRDLGLLQAAIDRPRNRWLYDRRSATLPRLAAAYGYGLIRNHPFIDGSKRVGYIAIRLFLRLNRRDLEVEPADAYRAIMRLAAGKMTEAQLADWIAAQLSNRR